MSEGIAYLNGEFIPDSECKVHVTDRGFRVGDVVFDVEEPSTGRSFACASTWIGCTDR